MGSHNLSTSALFHAESWYQERVDYSFTNREKLVLKKSFTNISRRVFFVHTLPPSVTAALLSMYSRLENARGIRGHFVDNLLPLILLGMSEKFSRDNLIPEELKILVGEMQKFLKQHDLSTLDKFCEYSDEFQNLFNEYCLNTNNPMYWEELASSPRTRQFMSLFLDKYGHNSIARPVMLTFCVEEASILAVKSLEWVRPGAGYIELSTRFVRMDKAKVYPVWNELPNIPLQNLVKKNIEDSLRLYQAHMQSGRLEEFFQATHKHLVPEKEIAAAVKGEACDLLGNLLPAATLTSVGVSVSGESFSSLIKHLYLENTPETWALAKVIVHESRQVGGDQFLNHLEISDWEESCWSYLDWSRFTEDVSDFGVRLSKMISWHGTSADDASKILSVSAFDLLPSFSMKTTRNPYDKLPSQFENISGLFRGVMSFRGWRDLHRQGFCNHMRTYLTPELGFYQYDKPMPVWLREDFEGVHHRDQEIYNAMVAEDVPPLIREYPLALGNLVGFHLGGNLRQMEFVCWQRSKFSVNHEVREVVLDMDQILQETYSFWSEISRTDRTPVYVFARTSKGIPMMPAEPVVLS
jgi:thymidylate synthase ThyX